MYVRYRTHLVRLHMFILPIICKCNYWYWLFILSLCFVIYTGMNVKFVQSHTYRQWFVTVHLITSSRVVSIHSFISYIWWQSSYCPVVHPNVCLQSKRVKVYSVILIILYTTTVLLSCGNIYRFYMQLHMPFVVYILPPYPRTY
jgi:hypothetical protein